MYLKSLTLKGFKSFASATTLELEPGVTCVVGPNGSGKSNVVDALAWVMGEQGAKTLRGGKMEDVIFAGTSGRAPLGRAEVSLTIDNSDGALPIDYTEVTISRTLFRNGGSEYAINGTPCRLLDVQELLSDSGLGRQMHVIVGQGQLDAVLRATPEERRGFIEEAAGVLKHRRRKEKALRKLEAMAANFTRLQDLTSEIRRQLGPLAKQAEVARRAATVQADLRDAKARLLADDLAQLLATVEQERVDENALRERQTEVETALGAARATVTELELSAAAAAPALDAASETWYRLSSLRERLRGLQSLATERIRLLAGAAPAVHGQDPEELETQAERVRVAERELAQEVELARGALESAVRMREAAEERGAEAATAAQSLQRAAADRREGLARLTGLVEAQRDRCEASRAEQARLETDLARVVEEAQEATVAYAALEIEVADVEAGEVDLDAAHETATDALEEIAAEVETVRGQLEQAERDVATWTARVEALELALDRKDGAGTLLAADDLDGVVGSLAAQLSITPGFEDAVAAALGPHADAVTVVDAAAAVEALRWLRLQDAGRSALVVAHDDDATMAPPAAAATSRAPEGCERLLDVVTARAEIAGPLHVLLDDVVVVDSLAHARAVVAEHPGLRAVTREGDLLSTTTAWGGSASAPSALHLQSALDAARTSAAEATTRASEATGRRADAEARLAQAREHHEATLGRLNASDARMAAVAEQLGRLGAVARRSGEEQQRIEARLAQVATQLEERLAELADMESRLEAAQADPEEADGALEEALGERDRLLEAASSARTQETESRLTLRTSEERARALAGRARGLEQAAQRERDARRRAEHAARQRAEQSQRAQTVVSGAATTLAALERSLQRAVAERDAAQQARAAIDADVARARGQVEERQRELAELTSVAHRDEIARAQQALRLEQLQTRAMEELGIEPDVLVEEYGPHQGVPVVVPDDPAVDEAAPSDDDGGEGDVRVDEPSLRPYVRAEQEKRLRAAERAMALLGRVNPLALEEYAALEERHRFLAEQLDDLKRSRADLMQIVRDIDDRVERVFAEAYADTAREFDGVFARLFPGGEGRLVLTEPDSMLTTGVEVEARPAGKKVKRLSLLSGGERSLTAVALLVAIFKARPSPFYVMDEVEAALDDVNLGRLLEIFTELRADSQLIVITHQKRTMEIADALYGVTMRGDGVTTVISQRLREAV